MPWGSSRLYKQRCGPEKGSTLPKFTSSNQPMLHIGSPSPDSSSTSVHCIQPATICLPRSIQTKRNHSKSPSLHYLDHTPQLRERVYEFGQNSLLMYYNFMNEIENQPILTCFSIDLNQKKKKKPRNITGIGSDFSAALQLHSSSLHSRAYFQ